MTPDDASDQTPATDAAADQADAADARDAELDAFDLDHDGKISIAEDARARLGLVDARLEEIAHEGGLKGKLADGAHHLLDHFDND